MTINDDLIFTEEELKGAEFIPEGEEPGGQDYDQPDSSFVTGDKRSPTAKTYERKTRKVLNAVFRQAVVHESTVPDAAAIIMYGPQFAEKLGDLAAHDVRVRRGIDMITEGSENPYLAFAVAAFPLVTQVWRNHEESLSPTGAVQAIKQSRARAKEKPTRQIKIPFTKRFLRIRFRLSFAGLRNMTNDPNALASYVFSNQEILDSMAKAGITQVAFNGSNPAAAKSNSRPQR